jgi:hypothetical protein
VESLVIGSEVRPLSRSMKILHSPYFTDRLPLCRWTCVPITGSGKHEGIQTMHTVLHTVCMTGFCVVWRVDCTGEKDYILTVRLLK